MITEKLIQIPSEKDEYIALWKIADGNLDSDKHVFLTHGTFSNRKVCMGIASFLAENGHTCWIMEWRNHGNSSKTKGEFNFETIAKRDFLFAFEYLFKKEKISRLNCITHSGGGICLTMFLLNYPQYISLIKTISFFACQAFGAGINPWQNFKIWMGKCLTFLVGYVPGQKFGREHDEPYSIMKQWYNWNLSGEFLGENNRDYLVEMPKIDLPILSVCGKGDTFIAPVEGCEQFLNGFQNPKNKLLFCSIAKGFLEDYDHSRILHSQSSRKEIWPLVLDWMEGS